MASRHYSGIGSRETPPEICDMMTAIAKQLSGYGFILRSGHAPGADQAFEHGAGEWADIYLPWPSFESDVPIIGKRFDHPTDDAMEMAKEFHPAWNRCGHAARKFHARNCHQVLGPNLDDPVAFVVCWTKGGKKAGGTAQAMRIAEAHGIPVHNLWGASKGNMPFGLEDYL